MPLTSPSRMNRTLADWRAAYRSGELKLNGVYDASPIADGDTAWIARIDATRLRTQLEQLEHRLAAVGGDGKRWLVKAMAGAPIEVELWDVPLDRFGSFVAEIPAPLGIGSLELEDGRIVKRFICEPIGLQGARDITSFGGWRAYLASLK